MDGTSHVFLIDLPLLTLVLGVIGAIAWNRSGNVLPRLGRDGPVAARVARIAALASLWLLLTVASLWSVFLGGFVVCYLLLFWFGRAGAGTGLILLGALLVSIPFFWGWVVLRPAMRR